MSFAPSRRILSRGLVLLVFLSVHAGPAAGQPFAYITNLGGDTVSVIDTATETPVTLVSVGGAPLGVAVNPAGTRAYVGNFIDGTVSVIDAVANIVVATVTVGALPIGVAVNPAGTRVYVANDEGTVSVIDTGTNTVVATIPDVEEVEGLVVTPDGSRVYLANCDLNYVSVIDTATNTVTATIPTGDYAQGVAVTPDGTRVYVTNTASANVSVIDTSTNTVIATVPVGDGPYGVAVHPDGTRVYVANSIDDTVSVISTATNTVIATVPTVFDVLPAGASPTGVAVTPDGARVYVANAGTNNVAIIATDTNTLLTVVSSLGSAPQAFGDFIGVGPAATRFEFTTPASATAGVPFTFTVAAMDRFDHVATGYKGTVEFTKSDSGTGSSVPADSTFVGADAGAKTFTDGATLVTAGDQTLTATDTVTAITGTSDPIAVSAAAATHLALAAPASTTAGVPLTFTVTARDQFENVATGYTGTVHFTRTDTGAGSAVPPDYPFVGGDAGTKTFTNGATLVTAGTQTLTATDTGVGVGAGEADVLVTAAGASRFEVTAPASVDAGSPFTFDVTALDPFDNVATAYAGTVHFTSSDPLATLPADSTLTSGAGTFAATLGTVGPQTLTARDTVAPGITGTSGSIAVAAVTSFSGSSATGSGAITAAFTGGGAGCTLAAPQFIGPPPGAPPIPPTTPGAGIVFPHGLFLFTTTGCTPGATITITVTYPQAIEGAVYWKYGPTPLDPAPRWYILPATIAGNTATFSITDGGVGDDDRTVNGTIVDQGGPGFPPPIPTLSEWMFVALALLLLAGGCRRLLRRTS